METADGRGPTRSVDRGPTATATGRARWPRFIVGVRVGAAHEGTEPDQAVHLDRVVHRVGMHAERPFRGRHHSTGAARDADPDAGRSCEGRWWATAIHAAVVRLGSCRWGRSNGT